MGWAQVVAGRAATGTQMAGRPDVADLPPMRKLLVPPGGP